MFFDQRILVFRILRWFRLYFYLLVLDFLLIRLFVRNYFLCFVLKGKRREIDESDDDGVKTVCCFEFRLETMLHRRYCVFTRGFERRLSPFRGPQDINR